MTKIQPYIGTRDFYPDDMEFRNWLFGKLRAVCESYGYLEYQAPILEHLDLYRAKSSEEIVNEQLYSFRDRGKRDVAIRPEMTPTLARMVAARPLQYPRPMRWFSIANFMRYERPGKGRLREFYQLNVDLLGSTAHTADAEILTISIDLLKSLGAKAGDFKLRYSDRRLLDFLMKDLEKEKAREVGRLLDKREKLEPAEFQKSLEAALKDKTDKDDSLRKDPLKDDAIKGDVSKADVSKADVSKDDSSKGAASKNDVLIKRILTFLSGDLATIGKVLGISDNTEVNQSPEDLEGHAREALKTLRDMTSILHNLGYGEYVTFDPGIVRGFDYYTSLVFEINDVHPENKRALFGGGRYDKLLGLFGKEEIPAVGFGMGDVTLEDFVKLHELLPSTTSRSRAIFMAMFSEETKEATIIAASQLREGGIPTELSLDVTKKLAKQFEIAEKKGYEHFVMIGPDEKELGKIKYKNLKTGDQKQLTLNELRSLISAH